MMGIRFTVRFGVLVFMSVVLATSLVTLRGVFAPAYAATDEYCSDTAKKKVMEQYYASQNIAYYDPCSTACSSGVSATASGLTGEHNDEKIMNWLMSNGLTAAGAAGIVGNMEAESSLNPFRFQKGVSSREELLNASPSTYGKAWGLVQWDGGRRVAILDALDKKNPDYMQYVDLLYGGTPDGHTNAPPEVVDEFIEFELEYIKFEADTGGNRAGVWDGLKAFPNTEEGALQAAIYFHDDFEGSADSPDTVRNGTRGTAAKKYFNQFASVSSGQPCDTIPNGDVQYYSQHDPAWANSPYAGGVMTDVGCGPTSMAIILATTIDKNIIPTDITAISGTQNGGTSSHWELIQGVNRAYGLSIDPSRLSMDEAIEFIQSGKGLVWAGGSGDAPYTKVGHMVAFVGVKDNGATITVADPHSPPHEKIKDYSREHLEAGTGSMYGVPKR